MAAPHLRLVHPVRRRSAESKHEEMTEFAREVGLRYVSDQDPGITRRRHGRSFQYHSPEGRIVRDRGTLERIRALVIPPAYRDVWICADPRGHIQAVGRDERGRKQYRYHAKWRQVRDSNKFERMIEFGKVLPRIRKRTRTDLAQAGLSRTKVLAAVVQLLERTLIRVGNEEYARENNSFGLSTLQDRHVRVKGTRIQFIFRGKRGIHHRIQLIDRRLARIVKFCQDLPGQDLFQYVDESGETHPISSSDVNDYLRETSGEEFTAKDFRTWAATVLAATALAELGCCEKERDGKKNIVRAVESVARHLGNTPAICRKSYIHPAVLEGYLGGDTLRVAAREGKRLLEELSGYTGLDRCEKAVLKMLEKRLRRPTARAA